MENYYTCGPLNNELLFLSGHHRADVVFSNPSNLKDDGLLRVRAGNERLWAILRQPMHPQVLNYIRLAGFEGVIQCDTRRIDNGLISALVERWRPETNTFHMPFGEMTVTLQDVQVLWGLPVEGQAVCHNEQSFTTETVIERFFNLTGILLEPSSVAGQSVKISTILAELDGHFPEMPSDLECIRRARTLVLLLIGAVLFPTSANHMVNIKYLIHLENLAECGNLSWGSAVVAFLYRQLSKATSPNTPEISGPLLLLQMWAWERLSTTTPALSVEPNWNKPYGARWQDMQLSFVGTACHSLTAYRSQFNSITALEVKWAPYADILNNLPDICVSGLNSWMSETYLIFWDIVEPHMPSRVFRQFSMFQPVPTNNLMNKQLYQQLRKVGRAGVRSGNWLTRHNNYIVSWNNRAELVVTQPPSSSPIATDEYLMWYFNHTVLYLGNPTEAPQQHGFPNEGARTQMLRDGLGQVYQRSADDDIRGLAGQYMGFASSQHHVGYQPTFLASSVPFEGPPIVQQGERVRRPRPRRRHVPVAGHEDQHNQPADSSHHSGSSHHSEFHVSGGGFDVVDGSHASSHLHGGSSHHEQPNDGLLIHQHMSSPVGLEMLNPQFPISQNFNISGDFFPSSSYAPQFEVGGSSTHFVEEFRTPNQGPTLFDFDPFTSHGVGHPEHHDPRTTMPDTQYDSGEQRDLMFDLNLAADDPSLAAGRTRRTNAGINHRWCGT